MSAELRGSRRIGPWGTAARVFVGSAMVAVEFVLGIDAFDALLGLVAFPIATSVFVLIRGRGTSSLRLIGPEGHCVNCAIILAAFLLAPDAALLFYGVSMLVAAVRGDGGCELFALSNLLWRRDDEIACPIFWPIDRAETRTRANLG
jgi:hypothetical protein